MLSNPTIIGSLRCPNCGHEHIRVGLVSLERTLEIDHVDFFCHVCKDFINHINVVPFIKAEAELDQEIREAKEMLAELNAELS